jgi:acyl-CoA synthetase (AMP-forming)/AMP-acid ligase II
MNEGEVGPGLAGVQLFLQGVESQELPTEQVSELLAYGPNMMLGYFDPAKPNQPDAARLDGWFPTGDLALLTPKRNFEIIDRVEDTLQLPNGELVVARDIERVLVTHSGIWEAAALPYTTPEGRQRMIAFVVPLPAARNLTEPQLDYYIARYLRAAVCPERIFIYQGEALPRLPNGAIWRRALRAEIPYYL